MIALVIQDSAMTERTDIPMVEPCFGLLDPDRD
jgi:hypothetical protein